MVRALQPFSSLVGGASLWLIAPRAAGGHSNSLTQEGAGAGAGLGATAVAAGEGEEAGAGVEAATAHSQAGAGAAKGDAVGVRALATVALGFRAPLLGCQIRRRLQVRLASSL